MRYSRREGAKWAATRFLSKSRKKTSFIAIPKKLSIATAEGIPSERWWLAKTLTARGSGSTPFAWKRRTCPKNGTVPTAKNNVTKPRIPTPEATSSTDNPILLEVWCLSSIIWSYAINHSFALVLLVVNWSIYLPNLEAVALLHTSDRQFLCWVPVQIQHSGSVPIMPE